MDKTVSRKKVVDEMPSYEIERTAKSPWRMARKYAGGERVEVAQRDGAVMLRDSTQPCGTVLRCVATLGHSVVTDIKAGQFDGLWP